MVKNQKTFSKEISQVTDPIIAMKRTLKLRAKEKISINLLISVSENKDDAIYNLENTKSEEEIIRILNIARVRAEEESKYLQIDGDKILLYTKLLKYVLNLNHFKKDIYAEDVKIDALWKYGISGDNPIILVEINSIEDMYVIEEVISCYEFYRAKKVFIDLVIINQEANVYEKFVRDSINDVILNKQLGYLKNINTGIFFINNDEIIDKELEVFEYKSNVIIKASLGGIEHYVKELEEKEQINEKINRDINDSKKVELYPLKKEKLLFDNSYGGFTENGKEFFIYKNQENKLPTVWCNILANPFFGTVISDNLGGYLWNKNSRLNRLTAWNNDRVLDIPSEIFYIKDENNKLVWTINSGVSPNENYYYITHGFEDSLKIYKFKMKNLINEERRIKILVYIKTVLGEDEIITNGNLKVEKINNCLLIKNVFLREESFKNKIMYVMTDLDIISYTGEKENFFGEGDLLNPDGLYYHLNSSNGLGKNSCLRNRI